MKIETQDLFNTKFVNTNLQGFVDVLKMHLQERKKAFIVTANPITVLNSKDNHQFEEALQSADYITPDGIGILLAAKFMKKPLQERVTGFDVMIKLLEVANQNCYQIYLYGAHRDILNLAVLNIQRDYPNIEICGYSDGYQSSDEEQQKVAAEIREKQPDLIFVALGVPKQEVWIYEHLDQFEKGVFIGVGGSFDVLSGQVKRAPIIYQKLGIEWVYRMLSEPSRLKRITFIPKFFVETVKEKYK